MSNTDDIASASLPSPSSTGMVFPKLPIVLNPDGTITRLPGFPSTPATPDPSSSFPVLSKDVPLNPQHNTFLRMFLPRKALDNSSSTPPARKLPLVVYFHGGGFILCSASTTFIHDICIEEAKQAGVMTVSVEYRLAPEHRLPAAYDDAMEALRWIRTSGDEWLRDFADFSNCFLMGASAGGNIAYHVGLRIAASAVDDDLQPLNIRGLILHQPFFGGSERSPSELRLVNDQHLPLGLTDLMWELALPIGADRDHEYCNPTVGGEPSSPSLDQIRGRGWKVLVTGCEGDPLIDRQRELVSVLRRKDVRVIGWFVDGGYHGALSMDPTLRDAFLAALKRVVHASPSDDVEV